MKRISSLSLVGVLVIGIIMFLSPHAIALQIVGDPIEGNSFTQYFRFEGRDGPMNRFDMITSGNRLLDPGLRISDSNWNVDLKSETHASATSTVIAHGCLFGARFAGDLNQAFGITIRSLMNGVLIKAFYLKFRNGGFSTSVPDADIMWLLGPALIGLGLIGRKKYRAIQQ